MIKQERENESHVLVLDAGDSLVGDRTPAVNSEGKSSVEVMNLMGYDAMALGEGDLGKLSLDAIEQRIQEAEFSVLSANVLVAQTADLLTEPFLIRDMGGRRVAIVGLTGMATVPGLEFRDPLLAAREAVAQVREHADVIILLSHAGLEANTQIAEEVAGIDLIVSGGGTSVLPSPLVSKSGSVIVHADAAAPGHAGRRIGVGAWSFDPSGALTDQRWENLELVAEIADDPAIAAWTSANP